MNVNPIPEGYTSLTPFLVIDDAVARAEKAGATIREATQMFVTGERDRRLAEWAKEHV